MFPYWILFSVFAVGALSSRKASSSAPLLVVAAFATTLMVGFRYETGGDWFNYADIFSAASFLDLGEAISFSDPGYALLNWLAHTVDADIWMVNFICALIFVWGLVRFSAQQPNPWLAIVVAVPYLIIVVAMGYTRQAVAIGFLMAGLAALDRPSYVRFGVYIILAATFHKSAIVVLPLVALTAVRNRIVIYGLLLMLAAILYNIFLDAAVEALFTNYVEAELNSQGTAIRVIMNVVPAAIFLMAQKRFDVPEQTRKLWRNFSYASFAALGAMFILPSSTAVDRVALYFIPLQLFVWSRLPIAYPDKDKPNLQLAFLVIAYSASIQFVWLTQANHAKYWVPYQFYPLT